MAMDYNQTINLPKTAFPMRAGLPNREPPMLEEWKKMDVYGELIKKNQGLPKHILHDGPPFSNGDIHMGTAMNKILKDFINRSFSMRGYLTPYTPGWDNHGMPIESAIIKKNKINRKEMSVPDFRSACRAFAEDFVDRQRNEFIRLGVLGDWYKPYLPMDPSFEAEEVKVFGKMYAKGYIYKGKKPVYWCPTDETALAEAEIEYQDDPCTTIFVKFPVKDDHGRLSQYGDLKKMFFVIWTTTPWTLPGNRAICLNANFDYDLLKCENGEIYIVADGLRDSVCKAANLENAAVAATMKGSEFELMTAQHPLLADVESVILNGDHVTLEAGSGCVHTAPGFGADDFFICQKYDREGKTHIGVPVPVDEHGIMTDDAFSGTHIFKSNEVVLPKLAEGGYLLASENITHSYPHCWRCKKPIIFRATPQWFCSVESFKEAAAKACDDVRWLPAWGHDRIVSMVRERADWCISRQRRWGLPIPVFYCADCGKPICTDETIAAVSELFGREGSNAWYLHSVEEILPNGIKCPHCGSEKAFIKEEDTLDGWFDSGSSHTASLAHNAPDEWPADVYLEGADQYRGWFQSSLLTAVGALGKGAPYKTVLTHGWVVDGNGKAMHKSLGNAVAAEEIIKKYGADLLRLWVASSDYHADVRASDEIFKTLSQVYLKIRNTARYMLGNLDGFDPNSLVAPSDMETLDRWAITKLNGLMAVANDAYDNFEYHIFTHALSDFCVTDMSSFYLDIIKDRLYCDEKDGLKRRSAQTALYIILDAMTKMMSPILAFTGDEIWKAMPHREGEDARNVVLNQMSKPYADYALSESDMAKWDKVIALRDDINGVLETARAEKMIGKSLEADVELLASDELAKAAIAAANGLALNDIIITSAAESVSALSGDVAVKDAGVNFPGLTIGIRKAHGNKCSRCWKFDPAVGDDELCPRCKAVVEKLAQK